MTTDEETAPPPGLRFAPLHYFGQAVKILCWDDAAVRRAGKDNNSLLYGFLILAIAPALPLGILTLRNAGLGYPIPWDLLIRSYAFAIFFALIWIILQIGLAHLLAKVLFEAKGTFVAIMRAYLLGQLFQWLIVVPFIGGMLSGLGGIAVLMPVFRGDRWGRENEGLWTRHGNWRDVLDSVHLGGDKRSETGSIGNLERTQFQL